MAFVLQKDAHGVPYCVPAQPLPHDSEPPLRIFSTVRKMASFANPTVHSLLECFKRGFCSLVALPWRRLGYLPLFS